MRFLNQGFRQADWLGLVDYDYEPHIQRTRDLRLPPQEALEAEALGGRAYASLTLEVPGDPVRWDKKTYTGKERAAPRPGRPQGR